MLKTYLRREMHHAGRFEVGMSATDAEALCTAFNEGRDPTKNDFAGYNGAMIFITSPMRPSPLMVEPGNWIVVKPDLSIDVRADDDFCKNFCSAS
jgi:hypothetical protein